MRADKMTNHIVLYDEVRGVIGLDVCKYPSEIGIGFALPYWKYAPLARLQPAT